MAKWSATFMIWWAIFFPRKVLFKKRYEQSVTCPVCLHVFLSMGHKIRIQNSVFTGQQILIVKFEPFFYSMSWKSWVQLSPIQRLLSIKRLHCTNLLGHTLSLFHRYCHTLVYHQDNSLVSHWLTQSTGSSHMGSDWQLRGGVDTVHKLQDDILIGTCGCYIQVTWK